MISELNIDIYPSMSVKIMQLLFYITHSAAWSLLNLCHTHACLLAARPMTPQTTTAMTRSTLQQLLPSQLPQHPRPPSQFCLCRPASRPRKKSSPVGWLYSSACLLLVCVYSHSKSSLFYYCDLCCQRKLLRHFPKTTVDKSSSYIWERMT